ncbi:MAG: Spx/MgsR family RNA polymerase-binding regulatory protein [Synechococcaceae cyanobacterium]|nr:Spx/MgsR family RNA polymerase-binding regulatory protein [Synechococcaceae cyanobacterium]
MASSRQHRLYSYPACSTCRKAIAWLKERGIAAELFDITIQPPGRPELREALSQIGRSRLFNTSGQSYRALGSARVKAMDDQQAVEALASDGRLIKRPFLISADGRICTGFRPDEWEALLGC